MKSILVYSILRMALILAISAVLWILLKNIYIALLLGVIAAFPLSYILFKKPRENMALELIKRKEPKKDKDSRLEDDLLDKNS